MDAVIKLELAIERCARGGDSAAVEAAMAAVGTAIGAAGVDHIKLVNDRLDSKAEMTQAESDQLGHIALMLTSCAGRIRAWFAESLRASGAEEIKGDTWTAKLVKQPPRISIDWDVLKRDGQEYFIQMPAVDEAKVMSAVNAGVEVPGVKLEEQFELAFSVEKKAEK
jgi:hypothetical protein